MSFLNPNQRPMMNTCPLGHKHWGTECSACEAAKASGKPSKRVRRADHTTVLVVAVIVSVIVLLVLLMAGIIPVAWLPVLGA